MEPSMNSLMIKMCLTFETKKTFFLQECQDESRDVSESQDKETLEGASDNTGPRDWASRWLAAPASRDDQD